jgi:hypothetical protein
MEDSASGDYIGHHAGLGAQHAREVLSLSPGDARSGFVPSFGDPAAAGHAFLSERPHQSGEGRSYALIMRKNTSGAPLSAPESVAFFGCFVRYFFFAAFFAAFLAGAFLVAFFVAICLFSLFRWVASILHYKLQLSECIDSCCISVKKKTTQRWKKWQQFFFLHRTSREEGHNT